MHFSALDVIAALIAGGVASVIGGYLGGTALGAKFLGRDLSGFLGMLYGPAAGATGVLAGLVVIAVLSTRS